MNDNVSQQQVGIQLEKGDFLSLWEYFEKRGSEVKSTMLQVVALLIGFAAAILGYGVDKALSFDMPPSVDQPLLMLAIAAAGIAIVWYAEIVIADFGEHINRNFDRADAARAGDQHALAQILGASEGARAQSQPLPGICITVRRITRAFGAAFLVGAVLAAASLF